MSDKIDTLLRLEDVGEQSAEIEAPPNRSYEQALAEDGLATIRRIAEIYIPNFSEVDLDGLEEAHKFAMSDPALFEGSTLPDYVRKHYDKIGALFTAGDFRYNLGVAVAYSPDTEDWENQIRGLTLDEFDKLRHHPFEGTAFDRESTSTTTMLNYIYRLYHGEIEGGERDKAIDLLVGHLASIYYRKLSLTYTQFYNVHPL